MLVISPVGRYSVQLPSLPPARALRRRMFPKVPRIITSWLPRRDPKLLKSRGSTPCSTR